MLATKEGKIVAVKGDPPAPVNRGLNCIKDILMQKLCMELIDLKLHF